MSKFFNNFKHLIKSIPLYGWIIGVVLFALQYGMYRLAIVLSEWTHTIDYAFIPKIPFDDAIPLLPLFVIIYIFSYAFWVIGMIIVSKTSKANYINFLFVILISYLIGFLILWLWPTKMDRVAEGIMDYANSDKAFAWLLKIVYSVDGDQMAWNLFPSYHCLISLCCYLGICRQKEIHIGYRIFSIVMVVLISMSTVFTKQHYFIDIIGGLAIPLIVYPIILLINPGKRIIDNRNNKADAPVENA